MTCRSCLSQELPKDAICWLDVPVNKTNTAFTKAVDRLVGEAIMTWEQIRPPQPPAVDPKTADVLPAIDFLFEHDAYPGLYRLHAAGSTIEELGAAEIQGPPHTQPCTPIVLFLATLARASGTTISTSIHPSLDDRSAIYRPIASRRWVVWTIARRYGARRTICR